jgi:xanthine dehydrogenase small subunit
VLINEATPISDHRASAAYRSAMLGASLRKFYSENSAVTSSQEVGAS